MTALRVGIAGLGTVGAAVARIIAERGVALTARCGRAKAAYRDGTPNVIKGPP